MFRIFNGVYCLYTVIVMDFDFQFILFVDYNTSPFFRFNKPKSFRRD